MLITQIHIDCLDRKKGLFSVSETDAESSSWLRLVLFARSNKMKCNTTNISLNVFWADALSIFREFGTQAIQKDLQFRFIPTEKAKVALTEFIEQIRVKKISSDTTTYDLSEEEIQQKLLELGFTKRSLKPFQLRDLRVLLSLSNGANFSVPGAGKTTVAFALSLLTHKKGQHLLIVAPKSATQAWRDVVQECMDDNAPNNNAEPFTVLDGDEINISQLLSSGMSRFIISYDLAIRQDAIISSHIASTPSHLILDEAHRMKGGLSSQRGTFLLNIAALPVRRDILTGTPMPQSSLDIISQIDFLWPGHGLGQKILQGQAPKDILEGLFVRTTKKELELPPVTRQFIDVDMKPGQLALYSIIKNEFLRDFSKQICKGLGGPQLLKARKSVMRLLQLSTNPTLALSSMGATTIDSKIINAVIEEGHSAKIEAVIDQARTICSSGRKVVIWTIFTNTIESLVSALADLNPVYIHGGVPSGLETEYDTREEKIKRFHEDRNCKVLIANPAAAGEGISLHKVCHDAIYVDRSYVSTHFLQSIDRIHRLGLSDNQETYIYIYRNRTASGIAGVDVSVNRRLAKKIRAMQYLLNDEDLHRIAYDEEMAEDAIDYSITLSDIRDIINQLEGKTAPSVVDNLTI